MNTTLVTGGTDGIGKAIAAGLAAAGRRVMIVGRDTAKGRRAEEDIRRSAPGSSVEFLQADLSLVRDTERLATEAARRAPELSVLVHSAGMVRGRRVVTREGIESNFAVNYLSRFVLSTRLLPPLEAGARPDARSHILFVSGAARNGPLYFDDVNLSRNFSTVRAIRQFAEANDLLARELADRLAFTRTPVNVTCLKVGVVRTNIRREFPLWMKILVSLFMDPLLGLEPRRVADAALSLMLPPRGAGDAAVFHQLISAVKPIAVPRSVRDSTRCRRLWELSERLAAGALRRPPSEACANSR